MPCCLGWRFIHHLLSLLSVPFQNVIIFSLELDKNYQISSKVSLKAQANFSKPVTKIQLDIFLLSARSPPSHLPCRCSVCLPPWKWIGHLVSPQPAYLMYQNKRYWLWKIHISLCGCLLLPTQQKTQPWENELDCWHLKMCVYLSSCNIFSLRLTYKFICGTDVESNTEVAYLLAAMLYKIYCLSMNSFVSCL